MTTTQKILTLASEILNSQPPGPATVISQVLTYLEIGHLRSAYVLTSVAYDLLKSGDDLQDFDTDSVTDADCDDLDRFIDDSKDEDKEIARLKNIIERLASGTMNDAICVLDYGHELDNDDNWSSDLYQARKVLIEAGLDPVKVERDVRVEIIEEDDADEDEIGDRHMTEIIKFHGYTGFNSSETLLLKHVPLEELVEVNIKLGNIISDDDRLLTAEAQEQAWNDEYQDIIADDPDADLSGL